MDSLAEASAVAAAAAAATVAAPLGVSRANDRRGTYVGGVPADLLLLAGALCAAVLLLLSNLFTPFVLLGLIDARTPFVLQAALIGLLLVALVGGSVVRAAASLRRRRHRALVLALGGLCVAGLIAFQAAASAYSFDGFAPAAVEPALFSTDALLAHAAACLVCWTVAGSSHAPAAHLAHYIATTLLFNALCCRLLIALERHDPVRRASRPSLFLKSLFYSSCPRPPPSASQVPPMRPLRPNFCIPGSARPRSSNPFAKIHLTTRGAPAPSLAAAYPPSRPHPQHGARACPPSTLPNDSKHPPVSRRPSAPKGSFCPATISTLI
jgi:hypothetical protein